MADDGKALLLQTAADVGKYYAFIGQALRALYDPAAAAQLPMDLLNTQLDQLRASLAPVLDTNHVVKQNFAEIDNQLARIRKEKAVDDARRFGAEIQERAKVVSDLVALFRRL
jgi:hypothetical protein